VTAAASRYEGVAIAAGAARGPAAAECGRGGRWVICRGRSELRIDFGISDSCEREAWFPPSGSFLQNSNLGVVMATVGW
jgi:hypothetical protein